MSTCSEENLSCEELKLGDSQLWRRLLRKTGDCLSMAVKAVLSSTERTPSRQSVSTGSGTVAAGARSVSFETSSDFSGTILGVAAQPDRVYDFAVQQNDDTLGAIAYNVSTGSMIITKIV